MYTKIIFYVAVFGMMIFALNGVNQVNAEEVVVFDDTFENGLGDWEYFGEDANQGSFFCNQFPRYNNYELSLEDDPIQNSQVAKISGDGFCVFAGMKKSITIPEADSVTITLDTRAISSTVNPGTFSTTSYIALMLPDESAARFVNFNFRDDVTDSGWQTVTWNLSAYDDEEFVLRLYLYDGSPFADPVVATSFDNVKLVVTVPDPIFCNDMTIDELISSGNYNVIDNRDGHLDGTTIKGTNGDDLILASDAGNKIKAEKGNDCVIGGAGDDNVRGGSGDDIIFGQDGNDKLVGDKGDDIIHGGDGDDDLRGGSGDDALSCGIGTDTANGGKGTDTATADCETIKKVP